MTNRRDFGWMTAPKSRFRSPDIRRAKLVLTDALIAIAATAANLAPPTTNQEVIMDTAIARPELLLVADAVAREKNIDREEVLEAMEQAIQKAGRAKYGHEKDIRATIDRKTGDVRLSRWTEIVEAVENEETQMRKIAAQVPGQGGR